jgi:benzoate 4-monooxygenase
LAEKDIIAKSISFIVVDSDTTSTTMTNFVDIVSRSDNLQKSLQEELDNAFLGKMPMDWVTSFKEVEKLPVLNAMLRETMRNRPTTATGLERVTPKGVATIVGQLIPEGICTSLLIFALYFRYSRVSGTDSFQTLVSVPTLNIHRDEEVFKVNPTRPPHKIVRWLTSLS